MNRFIYCTFLIFFVVIALVLIDNPVTSATQKEEKNTSELAIRDAIAFLENKKLIAEKKDDQNKISAAIEALSKFLPKEKEVNEKNNPPLPNLNKKFSGKSSFNLKSKELSIYYDFKSKKQLDDFKFKNEKPQIGFGFLRLAGAEKIEHSVNFKTVKITTTIFIESAGNSENSSILGTNAGKEGLFIINSRGSNINLDFQSTKSKYFDTLTSKDYRTSYNKALGVFVPEFLKINIPISMSLTENKVSLKFGADEIAAPHKVSLAGNVTLAGGQGGIRFGPLTISGVPENDWLEDLMK